MGKKEGKENEEDKVILVVDDEPNVRRHLARILEDAGFSVVTASDGDEAMEIIRRDPPDLISLDLVMPRKSGRRLLYDLRKDKALSLIPVIIVTAHAGDELGQGDMEAIKESMAVSGPRTCLEKPVRPMDYVRCVQAALGIEESKDVADKVRLKEELKRQIQGAEPHALRRALEALRKKRPEKAEGGQ
ncbi:response regulator [Elusimicrobiota bacterium]